MVCPTIFLYSAFVPFFICLLELAGDDDSNSESTSGCSSLLPHLEHKRESRNTELQNLAQVEPLSVDQSSLQIIGSSLSQSLAIDLKGNRGRKTLSLHTFTQDNNLGVTPTEDVRFHKEIGNSYSIKIF